MVLHCLGGGGGITRKFSIIYYKEFLKLMFGGLALYQSRDTLSTQWIKPYHIVPDKVNLPHCLCTCMGWQHLVIHRLILNRWNFVLQAWPEHHDPHLDQDKFTVKRRQTVHKTASFYKFTSPDWISEKKYTVRKKEFTSSCRKNHSWSTIVFADIFYKIITGYSPRKWAKNVNITLSTLKSKWTQTHQHVKKYL